VKRCGKSAPRRQQWRWQGKPHTEQDQIGEERLEIRFPLWRELEFWRTCRLGASQLPGMSLEPLSNARPRGMTVLQEQSRRQNSAKKAWAPSKLGNTARICQQNRPAPAGSLGKPASEAGPFVFHLLIVLFHIVKPDRQLKFRCDQTAHGGRQVEFGESRVVLRSDELRLGLQ